MTRFTERSFSVGMPPGLTEEEWAARVGPKPKPVKRSPKSAVAPIPSKVARQKLAAAMGRARLGRGTWLKG